MGFRFRRSISIVKGLRVNLSKRGASLSIGGRGAHVTVGHGKVRETVGLPGTGLSYTHVEAAHRQAAAEAPGAAHRPALVDAPPQAQAPAPGLARAVARLVVTLGMLAVAGWIIWLLMR